MKCNLCEKEYLIEMSMQSITTFGMICSSCINESVKMSFLIKNNDIRVSPSKMDRGF